MIGAALHRIAGPCVAGFCTAVLFALVAAMPAHAIDIREVKSPGGIVAWFVHDRSVPLVTISFGFTGAGAAADPAGREGLANMLSTMLDEGAGDLASQDYQKALEEIAAELEFEAWRDMFGGHLRTLSAERDRAFGLLRLALTKPRFDAKAVERMRAQILAKLEHEAEDPNRIAAQEWYRLAFPDHPYRKPSDGTHESVKTIAAADLKKFMTERLARDRLVIGVVGDIEEAELARRLDEIFGDLPATAAPYPTADVTPEGAGKTIVVRKQIPQSVIILGHRGIKRDDPDWYAATLVNWVFGGGTFSSRLYEEIREKRGLAYSVYAYLNPMDYAGLVMGGTATQNARAAESLDLIRKEWRKLGENGITADELAVAKTYINGSFPLRLNSSRRIAGTLVAIQRAKLGRDYINNRPKLIGAVTLDEANRVARELYHADELAVVVVGDPEGIEKKNP